MPLRLTPFPALTEQPSTRDCEGTVSRVDGALLETLIDRDAPHLTAIGRDR
jgi:hypothetical protein